MSEEDKVILKRKKRANAYNKWLKGYPPQIQRILDKEKKEWSKSMEPLALNIIRGINRAAEKCDYQKSICVVFEILDGEARIRCDEEILVHPESDNFL